MRDTVFCAIGPDADTAAVGDSIAAMAAEVARYVPGYRLLNEPQFDPPSTATGGQARVAIFLEITGAGDFLPAYAGNLDIMTAAATRVGEELARVMAPAA
jgi:acetaldehyde dehydrogenase